MDILIIALIIVVAIIGIIYTVRHFTVGGGCCGGGGYKPKRKKLKNKLYEKTFKIEGMHCKNCKWRVEEVINDIYGVSAIANLKDGSVKIQFAKDVPQEFICTKLSRAGYTLK